MQKVGTEMMIRVILESKLMIDFGGDDHLARCFCRELTRNEEALRAERLLEVAKQDLAQAKASASKAFDVARRAENDLRQKAEKIRQEKRSFEDKQDFAKAAQAVRDALSEEEVRLQNNVKGLELQSKVAKDVALAAETEATRLVRSQYRKRSVQWHADRAGNEHQERYERFRKAAEKLSSPNFRTEYWETMRDEPFENKRSKENDQENENNDEDDLQKRFRRKCQRPQDSWRDMFYQGPQSSTLLIEAALLDRQPAAPRLAHERKPGEKSVIFEIFLASPAVRTALIEIEIEDYFNNDLLFRGIPAKWRAYDSLIGVLPPIYLGEDPGMRQLRLRFWLDDGNGSGDPVPSPWSSTVLIHDPPNPQLEARLCDVEAKLKTTTYDTEKTISEQVYADKCLSAVTLDTKRKMLRSALNKATAAAKTAIEENNNADCIVTAKYLQDEMIPRGRDAVENLTRLLQEAMNKQERQAALRRQRTERRQLLDSLRTRLRELSEYKYHVKESKITSSTKKCTTLIASAFAHFVTDIATLEDEDRNNAKAACNEIFQWLVKAHPRELHLEEDKTLFSRALRVAARLDCFTVANRNNLIQRADFFDAQAREDKAKIYAAAERKERSFMALADAEARRVRQRSINYKHSTTSSRATPSPQTRAQTSPSNNNTLSNQQRQNDHEEEDAVSSIHDTPAFEATPSSTAETGPVPSCEELDLDTNESSFFASLLADPTNEIQAAPIFVQHQPTVTRDIQRPTQFVPVPKQQEPKQFELFQRTTPTSPPPKLTTNGSSGKKKKKKQTENKYTPTSPARKADSEPPFLPEPPGSMSVRDMLRELRLETYIGIFEKEDIRDIDTIRCLGDSELSSLGIKLGPRAKIRNWLSSPWRPRHVNRTFVSSTATTSTSTSHNTNDDSFREDWFKRVCIRCGRHRHRGQCQAADPLSKEGKRAFAARKAKIEYEQKRTAL